MVPSCRVNAIVWGEPVPTCNAAVPVLTVRESSSVTDSVAIGGHVSRKNPYRDSPFPRTSPPVMQVIRKIVSESASIRKEWFPMRVSMSLLF